MSLTFRRWKKFGGCDCHQPIFNFAKCKPWRGDKQENRRQTKPLFNAKTRVRLFVRLQVKPLSSRDELSVTDKNTWHGWTVQQIVRDTCFRFTVNPMPTVAANDPGWNFFWSNCTRSDVLPTPLSPTKIVWKQTKNHVCFLSKRNSTGRCIKVFYGVFTVFFFTVL